MIESDLWKLESKDALALDAGDFQVLVQQKPGWALFLVWQSSGSNRSSAPALVKSGVSNTVKDAMTDAKAVLAHLMAVQEQGGRPSANAAQTGHARRVERPAQRVRMPSHLRVIGP